MRNPVLALVAIVATSPLEAAAPPSVPNASYAIEARCRRARAVTLFFPRPEKRNRPGRGTLTAGSGSTFRTC